MIQLHRLLARRAIHEGEYDTGRGPLGGNYLLDTLYMEDMSTAEPNAGLCTQPTDPTDGAVGVLISILE